MILYPVILYPRALGTPGRNVFRGTGFRDWDCSIVIDWRFGERYTAPFRAEFFNILNHPQIANPYGRPSQYGAGLTDDPSQTTLFGCGCATTDVAVAYPVIGSGRNPAVRLGMNRNSVRRIALSQQTEVNR